MNDASTRPMRLEGLHHITAITADVERNVEFYAKLLGLRLIWQGVNADDPDVRHIAYGDESGAPGSILTFFDMPGSAPGRLGAGMVHRISLRVADRDTLAWWADRLSAAGVDAHRHPDAVRFSDPEGLGLELVVADTADPPLSARAPDIPAPRALQGLDSVRAYARDPSRSMPLLSRALALELSSAGSWAARGSTRTGRYALDPAPDGPAVLGAGTVHHVAFATHDDDHDAWRHRLLTAGARPTPTIDRKMFRSVYFREPSGVLLELATQGPGFVFEPADRLGESLVLVGDLERSRRTLEHRFALLENPHAAWRRARAGVA